MRLRLPLEQLPHNIPRFVGVADIYARRLEEAKQMAPGAKTYLDYRHLLEDQASNELVRVLRKFRPGGSVAKVTWSFAAAACVRS